MSDASEPVVDSPVVEETPPVESVEPTDTASEAVESDVPASPAPESPADPYEEFGGRDTIEAAHRMYQAAQSEDGVIQLFLEAGRSLGLGLKEMETLFTSLTGSGGEEAEEPDPDEPLTVGQWQKFQQEQQQREAERQATAAREAARQVVQATVADLGLDPKDPATKVVLQFGDQYLKDDLSPEAVAAAVRRGHADYLAAVEQHSKAYLEKKRGQAASVPSAPSGAAAPAEPAPAEPQNVAEAIKIARKRLGLSGG